MAYLEGRVVSWQDCK